MKDTPTKAVSILESHLELPAPAWLNSPTEPPSTLTVISDGQREALEVIAKSQTAPYRQVQRARVLLLGGDGPANARIAEQVGITVTTVRAWRARFAEDGLGKLGTVRAGRGRKSTIPQAKIDEIVELTRHSKPAGHTHWSCRTMAARVGVSPATVQRVCGTLLV